MKKKLSTHILVGLGYGDEGKGTMTDYLCRLYGIRLVVRYNGGSQAAHNVVTDTGQHHMFSQIGSASFVPKAKTILSKYMLFDPLALAREVAEFSVKVRQNILDRHFIDCRAPVITPFHIATNCIKEWFRGRGKHGSCGKGVGETGFDLMYFPDQVLRAGLLGDATATTALLRKIQERKCSELIALGVDLTLAPEYLQYLVKVLTNIDEPEKIAQAYVALAEQFNIISKEEVNRMISSESSVFEGAQGMLLDEWHGFHPYTTWSTITAANAINILAEAGFEGDREIVGIMRVFATRHGAGPFVTLDPAMRNISPKEHNGQNEWQGTFQVGRLDVVQLKYALECLRKTGAVDSIALTHLDVLKDGVNVGYCDSYIVDGLTVTRLEPNFNQDLVHQESLTNLLLKAEGVVTGALNSPEEAVTYVEAMTGLKVKYLSSGPRPRDKRLVSTTA